MSNILWKNFHLCFSKLKCLPPPLPSSPPPSQPSQHHRLPPPEDYAFAATPASVLIKNFNSLYDITSSENSTATSTLTLATLDGTLFSSSSEDTDLAAAAASTSPPDLASVYASQRFFFSSPGRSNSIIDSHGSPPHPPSTELAEPLPQLPPEVSMGGFTEQKYSSDPYQDFRRSMQEMIEARDMKDLRNDNWEYLHELLLCYLALNPKETHKFIIGAFTDIVVLLMSRPPPPMPPAVAVKSRKPGGRRQRVVDPARRSV